MSRREQEHLIQTLYPGSIAEELEIEPGDVLLKINGQKIEDVFDYRYLMKDEYVEVLIRKPSGEEWLLEIDKEYDDELGVEFENGLMSEYRSCSNKCMFCFIDQMPPGMRETLYFKDDDSRLSFLQGNYITMTNMKQADIDRIIHMQLAPINISVQTTNPELRCKMLHNRFAGEKLKFLQDLYEAHIEMNGQIVLCKGVNDKDELKRSIEDLSSYLPFMRSVSVVPAGLTKYREGLYPLELFSKEPITLSYLGLCPQVYPIKETGKRPESEEDRRIYELCLRSLRLCMMEHYVDCPWREQCLYAFDSRNQMLAGYDAFKGGNAAYARANLKLLAMDTRSTPLLSICAPCGTDFTIPSFSLHFVLALEEYFAHTGDGDFMNEVYEKVWLLTLKT